MSRKPPTARATAIGRFKLAHDLTYGKPSGKTLWHITVSKDPRKWRYEAEFIETKEGALCPLSYVKVTACISWYWAEARGFPDEQAPWSEAIAARQILILGAVPIPAPEPADTAILLSCVESASLYRGHFSQRTFLALGNHSLLCKEDADPAPQLIEHIREISIERFTPRSLSSKSPAMWAMDELDKWK
jgi:hypothetical protein